MESESHLEGLVTMFNKTYGFIEYDKGDIYFHISCVEPDFSIEVGDKVSFSVEKSPIKKDKLQAFKIKLIEKLINDVFIGFITSNNYKVGYGGKIKGYSDTYYYTDNSIINNVKSHSYNNNLCIFNYIKSKNKSGQYKAVNIYVIESNTVNYETKEKIETALNHIKFEYKSHYHYYDFIKQVLLELPLKLYPEKIFLHSTYLIRLYRDLDASKNSFTFIKDGSNLYDIVQFDSIDTIQEEKIIDSIEDIYHIVGDIQFDYVINILRYSKIKNYDRIKINVIPEYLGEFWDEGFITEIDSERFAVYIDKKLGDVYNKLASPNIISGIFSKIPNEKIQVEILEKLSELPSFYENRMHYYGNGVNRN